MHDSVCIPRLGFLDIFNRRREAEGASASGEEISRTERTKPAIRPRAEEALASTKIKYKHVPAGFDELPSYLSLSKSDESISLPQDLVKCINDCVDEIAPELKEVSLKIHDHPELGYEEKYAHDVLTKLMQKHGFKVERHCGGLSTAWRATFSFGVGGRVMGINSEMDALPGIGHACGHNLIAAAGVGAAIAAKAALERYKLPGKIVILGTPAEEGGAGKIRLLEKGAYNDMDFCVMCHPTDGPINTTGLGGTLSLQEVEAEFTGHTAHAAAAPWEGKNALDAAFLAYSSISVLRQQIKPTHRVHGIVEGKNWAPNVIPDYAKMRWFVRAPTGQEVKDLMERVIACFNAAGLAASCAVKITTGPLHYELMQNTALGDEYKRCARALGVNILDSEPRASTDFGNVTYALPALHPRFTIPAEAEGGNHTAAFAKAAGTKEAHEAMLYTIKALVCASVLCLKEDNFFEKVRKAYEEQKAGLT